MKVGRTGKIGVAAVLIALLGWALFRPGVAETEWKTEAVERGPLRMWSVYEGKLESRTIRTVMSRVGGSATLIDLAPEGARVAAGDILARFDASKTERDLVKLEADVTLARSEYDSLQNAQIPLKLREMELQVAEAGALYESELDYLEDSRSLLADDLISEQEIRQQEAKVKQAKTKEEHLETQLDLTQKYLNPLSLESARTRLASAEQALAIARQDVENCVIKAPADGMVVYLPAHVAGEYRTVRVGDSVYRNQPFMAIPDMSNLVIHCYVPESDLSRVGMDCPAIVTPVSYPGMILTGRVESVGSMAQTLMDKPNWQKFFHVILDVQSADERLRSGMSVTARILSYENPDAIRVPRLAVSWIDGQARCRVMRGRTIEERDVTIGQGDDTYLEVLDGLSPGELVVTE